MATLTTPRKITESTRNPDKPAKKPATKPATKPTTKPPKGPAKEPTRKVDKPETDASARKAKPEIQLHRPRECQEITPVFHLMGDGTRMAIIEMLSTGPTYVAALTEYLSDHVHTYTQPGVSHHLALMRHAGLVRQERAGRQMMYTLTPAGRNAMRLIVMAFKMAR